MRKYFAAQKKYGHLVTRPMAAELLQVAPQSIQSYLRRGRLTDIKIGPTAFIPATEVMAIWKERYETGKPVGGGGGPKAKGVAKMTRLQAAKLVSSCWVGDEK